MASVASIRVAEGVSRPGLLSLPRETGGDQVKPWQSITSSLGAAEPLHVGEIAAGSFGLVLFRALGGRFSSVAPSALHMPGAFSRFSASIPATLEYATDAKRQALAVLGKNFGCHTCGTRAPSTYIADHMPPLKTVKLANAALWRKLLRQTVSQRFYPQCKSCSALQSVAVRTGATTLKYHIAVPGALRAHHAAGALLVLGNLLLARSGGPFRRQDDDDDSGENWRSTPPWRRR
ncbi:unnamed protein product [Ascophyllum nodosum]